MKKRPAIVFLSSLLLTGVVMFASCKKKEENPAPTVNTDNVDMGTDATATVNVLANDTYKGSANLSATVSNSYGIVSITSDNKVLFTPKTNYYGTVTISYTLRDDNGSSTGSVIIKRGTDAQINTSTILRSYVANDFMWLYSVDGDSSRIYSARYAAEQISFTSFESDFFKVYTDGVIIPSLGNYTYSISSDGSLLTHANSDNSSVILTTFESFTASAKKHDGSGNMTVNGFSFHYAGKILVYTTQVQ